MKVVSVKMKGVKNETRKIENNKMKKCKLFYTSSPHQKKSSLGTFDAHCTRAII